MEHTKKRVGQKNRNLKIGVLTFGPLMGGETQGQRLQPNIRTPPLNVS